MFDSLPYRNDAAMIFRRLARSLPLRRGVLGIATCDKGLPAMMMAVAGSARAARGHRSGGVTLPATGAKMPARCKLSGRGLRMVWSRSRKRQNWLPRMWFARWRLPIPRNGGDGAGGQ